MKKIDNKLTIIIDTREQHPYTFPAIIIERKKLSYGDYSVAGFEDVISVERKSINDYVNTIIHNKERFRKELMELKLLKHSCIVVECSMRDIFNKEYYGSVSPASILGITTSIIVDYGIPVLFMDDRQIANSFVRSYLLRSYLWLKKGNATERL